MAIKAPRRLTPLTTRQMVTGIAKSLLEINSEMQMLRRRVPSDAWGSNLFAAVTELRRNK